MTLRRVVSIAAAVGLVAAGLVVGATPADAGTPNFLVVTKVVHGPVPPGTEFTVDVDCTENMFDEELTFPATGGTMQVNAGEGVENTCTITEPQTGGASTTTFACQVTAVGAVNPATCQGTNIAAFAAVSADWQVTITVTNTFVPAPAAAVPAAPTFTG